MVPAGHCEILFNRKSRNRTPMNRKSFHIFIVTWLTVLFTVIVPLHTHDDHGEHDNCSICLLAGQSAAMVATVLISLAVISSSITYVIPSSRAPVGTRPSYRTRAPPARQHYS